MLLNRLFRFIRSKEGQLNAVLSGYFCNLFNLLLNRKQKQIIPYLFGDVQGEDVMDCLLQHVY